MTTRTTDRRRWRGLALALAAGALAGCGGAEADRGPSGAVQVDGSSTVYPITEAVAEEFLKEARGDVRVTVGISGTGGGFKRFCAGETDISDASRPIKASEAETCAQNGVEYLELPVAYDGLSVVVNPQNTFCDCLTVDELKRIWEPGSTVRRWSDVRPNWPSQPIRLYGPGTDSGTFDYFTEAIVGKEDASRPDFTASEDDNVLVQGVEGDASALGYFGYAYYVENQGRLKLLGIDSGSGCVQPSRATIESGTYAPLSRPIFIYVSRRSLARPEVAAFARYYMQHAPALVPEVGYIALSAARYEENLRAIEQAPGDAR